VAPLPWRRIDAGAKGIGTMPAASAGVAGLSPGPAVGQCLLLVSRRISVVQALGGQKARESGAIPLKKLTDMTYPTESSLPFHWWGIQSVRPACTRSIATKAS
jgi:hypothetical protein